MAAEEIPGGICLSLQLVPRMGLTIRPFAGYLFGHSGVVLGGTSQWKLATDFTQQDRLGRVQGLEGHQAAAELWGPNLHCLVSISGQCLMGSGNHLARLVDSDSERLREYRVIPKPLNVSRI